MSNWNVDFLQKDPVHKDCKRALIILNQPFSRGLFHRLWNSTQLHYCADGGSNRLYDTLNDSPTREQYLPDLIKGDLDSIRSDVRAYYELKGVRVVQDHDQNSTDLMKCIRTLQDLEETEGSKQYDIILLGGLSGRLDQTIHTLSYLHKLRKTRRHVYAVTDDNIGWVLDEGTHDIAIDHDVLGQTCGLLPVGIDSTKLSTSGLKWNLNEDISSFDGLVSTSNHLVPGQDVRISTTRPIWWTVELKCCD
ncbi:thiamine pyrophosphokinase Thi80 [Crucibulum laeve]|uniref:Thiamine pyrophosphokinase n=1 Tax=Crucibulum laeve TaxID=68775 RepID=A0A5C3M7B8_9AGAR|nr:thiamine pyrophosphokinase Thi80 [Crucibulum laeve]